jgi:hypothetical protein
MKGTPRLRKAQYQTIRAVLVQRIIFDDFAVRKSLPNLVHANAAKNALIDGMLRELERAVRNLLSY